VPNPTPDLVDIVNRQARPPMSHAYGADQLNTTLSGGLELVHETQERVVGPILGRFLACYTVRNQQAFVAYAKICRSRPHCPWSALTGKKVSSGPHLTSDEAIDAVIAKCTAALQQRRQDRLALLHYFLGDAQ
jgi:hypothetical protein